jgi:hypothetical protein
MRSGDPARKLAAARRKLALLRRFHRVGADPMSGLLASRAWLRVAFVALALAGCSPRGGSRGGRAAGDAGVDAGSALAATTRPATPQAPSESATERPTPPAAAPPRAGEVVRIPAGPMRAGSLPGTPGRAPGTEADLLPVTLPAFTIDRLPFPNDPALPPRASVSRAEAAALCGAAGRRLCTDLEWERACEGPTNDTAPLGAIYPGGTSFDPETCGLDPLACASPEGVLSLGTTLGEWTASAAPQEFGPAGLDAIVRGGAVLSESGVHRCASRRPFPSATTSEGLGFRCCSGDEAEASYPPVARNRSMFQDRTVETPELRRILGSLPELARFAQRFTPFDAEDVDRALGRGGQPRDSLGGWAAMNGVLVWAPTDGESVWIVAGTSGPDSLLAALYPMPDGSFLHAASFILENEAVPVVVAYGVTSRRELLWSTCWGCGGEGGAITLRDDATIVITQR